MPSFKLVNNKPNTTIVFCCKTEQGHFCCISKKCTVDRSEIIIRKHKYPANFRSQFLERFLFDKKKSRIENANVIEWVVSMERLFLGNFNRSDVGWFLSNFLFLILVSESWKLYLEWLPPGNQLLPRPRTTCMIYSSINFFLFHPTHGY